MVLERCKHTVNLSYSEVQEYHNLASAMNQNKVANLGEIFQQCSADTDAIYLNLRGGYAPDIFFSTFCVRKPVTRTYIQHARVT